MRTHVLDTARLAAQHPTRTPVRTATLETWVGADIAEGRGSSLPISSRHMSVWKHEDLLNQVEMSGSRLRLPMNTLNTIRRAD